jgi:NADH-quinone oxidoreductase subunit N
MFYLLAYGLTTIGCFAIVMLVRGPTGEAGHLSSWAGLGRTSPVVAGVFAFLLLALAGIPLTSGFTAKFGVFSAAIASGAVWPVVVAVVASAISAFFYLKVIVLMYFAKPAVEGGAAVAVPSVLTQSAIVVAVLGTVVLGVFPQAILNLVTESSTFLR